MLAEPSSPFCKLVDSSRAGLEAMQAVRRVCRFSSGAHAFASTSFSNEVWRRYSRGRAVIASVKWVMAG